jgi:hypothetical protein
MSCSHLHLPFSSCICLQPFKALDMRLRYFLVMTSIVVYEIICFLAFPRYPLVQENLGILLNTNHNSHVSGNGVELWWDNVVGVVGAACLPIFRYEVASFFVD